MFAHKSYVVNWNDTVYHFYCAVNNSGQRGIAVVSAIFAADDVKAAAELLRQKAEEVTR